MMNAVAAVLAGLSLGPTGIDPEFAANITVYHVNPGNYTSIPVNMDTADVDGDLYFAGRSVCAPFECADNPNSHDCSNPEVTASDLTVNKLIMEVDTRHGPYGRCNVAKGVYSCQCSSTTEQEQEQEQEQGSAHRPWIRRLQHGYQCYHELEAVCPGLHHGSTKCTACAQQHAADLQKAGCTQSAIQYYCGPGGHGGGGCGGPVGLESVAQHFGGRIPRAGSSNYTWWKYNAAVKLGGSWYSTTKAGQCNATDAPCYWRVVKVVKRVTKKCADQNGVMPAIRKHSSACFSECAQPNNISSPCTINCFYEALLGQAGGKQAVNGTGIAVADLRAAWEMPFADVSAGGCPAIQ